MSLPKFIRDIAPNRIVTALAVFSKTRGARTPPHNFAEGGTEPLAAVGLRDTLTLADLAEMVDGLSQGPGNADRIGRKGKQHG
jgi:hypothetical protein